MMAVLWWINYIQSVQLYLSVDTVLIFDHRLMCLSLYARLIFTSWIMYSLFSKWIMKSSLPCLVCGRAPSLASIVTVSKEISVSSVLVQIYRCQRTWLSGVLATRYDLVLFHQANDNISLIFNPSQVSIFTSYPRPVLAFGYCHCPHLCVYPVCVNHELVCTITHHPFKLGSPNLDQRCKVPWIRSLLFFWRLTWIIMPSLTTRVNTLATRENI